MNYFDVLRDYLDGDLESFREEVLFTELARDPALRQAFNDHLKIRAIVQSEIPEIVPPAESADIIFSQVGYTLPAAGGAAGTTAASAGLLSSISAFFRGSGSQLLSIALASVLSFMMAYIIFEVDDQEPATVAALPVNEGAEEVERDRIPAELSSGSPEVPARTDSEHIEEPAGNVVVRNSALLPAQPTAQAADNERLESVFSRSVPEEPEPSIAVAPALLLSSSAEHSDLTAADAGLRFGPQRALPYNSDPLTAASGGLLGMIQFRSISGRSNPNVDLPSQSDLLFNDVAFSILFDVSDDFSFGLEAGSESFGQEYTRFIDNSFVTVRQNPQLRWVGATMRFEPSQFGIGNILYPYGQLTVAGAEVGPLGKVTLGARLLPEGRLSVIGGIEGSLLQYWVDGTGYTSSKWGLFYGLSFRY